MGNIRHPRRGSLQYWPRARSSKHAARVRAWATTKEQKLLGFIGYKVGMTHLLVKETNPNSPRKNMDVFTPVTVVECPPLKVLSVRYYRDNDESAAAVVTEVFSKKVEKRLTRKTGYATKETTPPTAFDGVKVVVYTQPWLTGVGKKKPDLVELGVGGKTLAEQSAFALSLLDKEVRVTEVVKEFQLVDVHGVTKGKGFSGVVKKFGVKLLHHKSEKGVRGIGTMGSWHPNRVQFSVPQAGKWGYLLRTDYNKLTLKVGSKPVEINPKGGFVRYGLVKSDYVLLKGSVPGPAKRPVTFVDAIRPQEKVHPATITYTSVESKQR